MMRVHRPYQAWLIAAVVSMGGCARPTGADEAGVPLARRTGGLDGLSVQRVKDLSPGDMGSTPANLEVSNGKLFFAASGSDDQGTELWVSDGTEAGTLLVKDLWANSSSSSPSSLLDVNGTLFFSTNDGATGSELWRSDGTAAGTVRVKDIYPGSPGSVPTYLTNVNGTLFFSANDGSGGELWRSDGTAAGTVRVKDIYPGAPGSFPVYLTNVNGTLFFRANDGASGNELWKSDGTEADTVRVKDIWPGTGAGVSSSAMTAVGTTFYFVANDGTSGAELWKSDGTEAGTVRVKDIYPGSPGSAPEYLTNVNGTLFFAANDGASGYELWKSDGTEAGTVRVKELSPSTGNMPAYLTNVNGTLFFMGDEGVSGRELWKSDGTEAGTVRVKDIAPGALESQPAQLTLVQGQLYFAATDGVSGRELWKSDGTEAGTVRVKDIAPGSHAGNPASLKSLGGTLYFSANDFIYGAELWKSDGTEAGTVRVRNVRTAPVNSSSPLELTNVNGTLFLRATDTLAGIELWKSDGTEAGTVCVKDITPLGVSGYPTQLTNVNGTLFFNTNEGTGGTELWKSDGTEAGTVRVKDIRPGSGSSQPDNFAASQGVLYFWANDGVSGWEPWKSDGTEAGTVRLKDIAPGSASSLPGSFTHVPTYLGDRTFFVADDGVRGTELWWTEGMEYTTELVANLKTGSGHSVPRNLLNVNGLLFYVADDDTGTAIYKTGVPTGFFTQKLASPTPWPWHGQYLADVNGTIYFVSFANGFELWKTDGTDAGTVRVRAFPWSQVSPERLTNVNGTLFFTMDDGVNGRELWKSDGTEAGTVLVKDIQPGSTSSTLDNLTNMNGTLFFTADDGVSGVELWVSDGTAAGTRLVGDIMPGALSSSPGELTVVGDSLYFRANDAQAGSELWRTVVTPDTTAPTVALTAPTEGQLLSKTVTLSASAVDDRAVTKVEFHAGSTLLGTVMAAPWSLPWDTRLMTNGGHLVSVKAYDAAGNVGTSTPVPVTIDNDLIPPTVALTFPQDGASVSGVVVFTASAQDNVALAAVEFLVDGMYGVRVTGPGPSFSFAWNSLSVPNGSHTLTAVAFDTTGNTATSGTVLFNVNNGTTSPSGTATYDATRQAPVCATPGNTCDSGTLLDGRAGLGPETNAPNTLYGLCADGMAGSYHSDESLDRLKVMTTDGTPLAPGKTVRIEATVWAYSNYSSDYLDLYYAADATNPSWVYLTTLSPMVSGAQTLTATYTLPSGALQAVRGIFRYAGSASGPCVLGSYDDHDDLVFVTQ
ncbi:ELWxxDGT repeat protein [Archangium lansingense]|uniref:ELWxxDGT repeat protein n=1 Tax=Archangium lansingense TaxID=2995310 RepID=UPI003B78E0BD